MEISKLLNILHDIINEEDENQIQDKIQNLMNLIQGNQTE